MSEDKERVTAPLKRTIVLADGKEYVIKPLTLKDTKNIIPAIKKFDELRNTKQISEELIDQTVEVAYLILSRGNEGIVKEALYDLLELDSTYKMIALVTGV